MDTATAPSASTAPTALAPAEPPIPRHIVITHASDTELVEAKDDSNSGRPPRLPRTPLAKNLPLVDEIDLRDCLVSPATPWRAAAIQGAVIGKEQLEVICNHGGDGGPEGYHACPCCRRFVQNEGGNANAPSQEGKESKESELHQRKEAELQRSDSGGALATLWSSLTMQSSMAAPPLSAGDEIQSYSVTETIVQGWLYKKGTGDDWAGRRWWKPRWVTLAVSFSAALLDLLLRSAELIPNIHFATENCSWPKVQPQSCLHHASSLTARPACPTRRASWN